MSATTELLSERLRELEGLINEAAKDGRQDDVTKLINERDELTRKLAPAVAALNEGSRRLLKG